MLVLTRKVGQAIFIGNPRDGAAPIEITVEEVQGDNVRLGIVAPRSVAVDRSEVAASKQAALKLPV